MLDSAHKWLTLCSPDIDDCANSPCRNGATCIDGVAQYSCKCKAGYDGDNCENSTYSHRYEHAWIGPERKPFQYKGLRY